MRVLDGFNTNSYKFIRKNKALYLFLILLLPLSLKASPKIILTQESSIKDLNYIRLLKGKAVTSFNVANIRTIEDLMRFSADQLLNLRGMAETVVTHIDGILKEQNLSLASRKEALKNKQHILQIPIKCLHISKYKDTIAKDWLNRFFRQFEETDFTIQDITSLPITDYFKTDLNNRERVYLRDYLLDKFEISSEYLTIKDFISQTPVNERSKIEDLHLGRIVKYDPTDILKEANIQRVEDLLRFSAKELMNIKGLNRDSVQELSAVFAQYGISWETEKKLLNNNHILRLPMKCLSESENHEGKELLNSFFQKFDHSTTLEEFLRKPGRYFIKYETTLRDINYLRKYLFEKFKIIHENLSSENVIFLDAPIKKLKVHTNSAIGLNSHFKRANILKIGELLKFSKDQLINIKRISENIVELITVALRKHDLQLVSREDSFNNIEHILSLPINSINIELKKDRDIAFKKKVNKFFQSQDPNITLRDLTSYPIEYYLNQGLTYTQIAYLKKYMFDRLHVKLDKLIEPLNEKLLIRKLNLAEFVRTENAIRIEKIFKTVSDLLDFSEEQIRSILGLSLKDIKEISTILGYYGFSLRSHEEAIKDPRHILKLKLKDIQLLQDSNYNKSLTDYIHNTEVLDQTVQDIISRPMEYYFNTEKNNQILALNTFLSKEAGLSFLNIANSLRKESPIQNLYLSAILGIKETNRIQKIFKTVSDLLDFSEEQLRSILGLSPYHITKMIRLIGDYDLSLRNNQDALKNPEHILKLNLKDIKARVNISGKEDSNRTYLLNQYIQNTEALHKTVREVILNPIEFYLDTEKNNQIFLLRDFLCKEAGVNFINLDEPLSKESTLQRLHLIQIVTNAELIRIEKVTQTIGELVEFSEVQLKNILNISSKSVAKIVEVLEQHGFYLAEHKKATRNPEHILKLSLENIHPIIYQNQKVDYYRSRLLNEYIQEISTVAKTVRESVSNPIEYYLELNDNRVFLLQDFLVREAGVDFPNKETSITKESPIQNLHFIKVLGYTESIRLGKAVKTVGELVEFSEEQLKTILGLRVDDIQKIIEILRNYNLNLTIHTDAIKNFEHILKLNLKDIQARINREQKINNMYDRLLNEYIQNTDNLNKTVREIISEPLEHYLNTSTNNQIFLLNQFLKQEAGVSFAVSKILSEESPIQRLHFIRILGSQASDRMEKVFETVGELCMFSKEQLRSVLGLELNQIKKINEILEYYNLSLMGHEEALKNPEHILKLNLKNFRPKIYQDQKIIFARSKLLDDYIQRTEIFNTTVRDIISQPIEYYLDGSDGEISLLNNFLIKEAGVAFLKTNITLEDISQILKIPIKSMDYNRRPNENNTKDYLLYQFFKRFEDSESTLEEVLSYPVEHYLISLSDYQIMFYVYNFFKDKYKLSFKKSHLVNSDDLITDGKASIIYLDFPIGMFQRLLKYNIMTVEDLLKYSKRELLSMAKIGPDMVNKISMNVEEKTIFKLKNY